MDSKYVISVGIVNWNTREAVLDLLHDLLSSKLNIQILVADNASEDGSQESFQSIEGIRLIQNENNVGFAKAHNQLWELSQAPIHILLNSDVRLSPDVFQAVIKAFEDPSLGIWGPQMRWENGDIQRTCRRFPTLAGQFFYACGLAKIFQKSKLFNGYLMGEFDHKTKREVDQVIGSFFAVRRELTHKIGFLDDRFFMYYEEVDYCKRAKEADFKVFYNPEYQVTHLGGLSANRIKLKSLRRTTRSMRAYFFKHYGWYSWFPLFICLSLEAGTKTIFSVFKKSNPLKTIAYYVVALWDFITLKPANKA